MSKTLSIENGRIVTVKLSLMLYTIRRLVEERNQVIHRFIIWLAAWVGKMTRILFWRATWAVKIDLSCQGGVVRCVCFGRVINPLMNKLVRLRCSFIRIVLLFIFLTLLRFNKGASTSSGSRILSTVKEKGLGVQFRFLGNYPPTPPVI